MTSFIIDLHNKCAYIYYKTEVAHYDRNSGSHISGMVAQAYRTGGSLEHRLFRQIGYVANSPYTVVGESYSAGRLYDKIGDEATGTVLYVLPKGVLCVLDLSEDGGNKE